MKAYIDIEQSKKLATILPIDSADMCYRIVAYNPNDTHEYQPYCFVGTLESDISCWSLAALLEVMPKQLGRYTLTFYWCDDSWCCSYIDDGSEIKETSSANNPVDACYEMIIKLNKRKLL